MRFSKLNLLVIFVQIGILLPTAMSISDSNQNNNNMSISINIVETKQLRVDFVPIDEQSLTFDDTIANNTKFLNLTYPLADIDIITNTHNNIFSSNIGGTLDDNERQELVLRLFREGRLSGKTNRVVGIVPVDWFNSHGKPTTKGYTYISYEDNPLDDAIIKAVIVEEGFRHGASHELAHTFGICDEYNNITWAQQDTSSGLCPNGDVDNDNSLDASCLNGIEGCKTSTIGKLLPWSSSNSTISLSNFMGFATNQDNRWVDNLTYMHLLSKLSKPISSLNVEKAILISGTINRNGTVSLDDFYILDEQIIDNETSSGNFSINLKSSDSLFFNMTFDVRFLITEIGGNTTETNVSPFAFVIPYSDNVTKILLKENETVIRGEKNVTSNTPNITITTQLQNQVLDNSFTMSWNATDLDNDTIQYAILISSDNGNTFSTLEIDYPNTSLTINTTNFVNSNKYKIKILATDGINTGNDTSDKFSIYHDNNQNKFLIKNSSGSNIAWFGDAGNIVIKGVLEQNSNFQATDNFAFKIRNNQNDVLIIENNGSMYIDGTLLENQATIPVNMDKNEFRFRWNGEFKTNINESGYIFTKGTLTQNGNP